jgi:hypothetical protein
MKKIFLVLFVIFNSCLQNRSEEMVVLPQNLEVTTFKVGIAKIDVSFFADNVSFFKVKSGIIGQDFERITGNKATFIYPSSGEFEIVVQAHASEADFISKTAKIRIEEVEISPGIPGAGFVSPQTYAGYKLVWQDEFEGGELSQDWVYDLGDGCPGLCGWGNNELQSYKKENLRLEKGYLIIEAKKELDGNKSYTSTRIKTQEKKSFLYGRMDIRAALPKGKGIWPAIWMLGENITEVGWPKCGEIDIMEMIGGEENTVHGTAHWDNNGQVATYGGKTSLTAGTFNDNFHVYSIVWDERKILWLLDDKPFHEIDITPSGLSEFHLPHFFLINMAVGGNWPGSPDQSTVFPQKFAVDYIRVFQKN